MPFGDLCQHYVAAGAALGAEVETVFLGAPDRTALESARYLNIADLADSRALQAGLRPFAGQTWDLVVCHRYRAYWAAVKTGLAKQRCVAIAHEYGLFDRWQRRFNRAVFARSCQFAGVSPGLAEELKKVTGQAHVLPNVIDVQAAEAALLSKERALAELGLTPGPLTVGVVGRLHYKKRPQLALDAFKTFAAEHPQSRLVFLGDGDERGSIESQADPSVQLLGRVPGAARLYAAFDVVLHTPSIESFGMVVLEAMFAGIPVVTVRGHGPEYVLGDLGYYPDEETPASLGAALTRAAQGNRQELLSAGRLRVQQHFSIQALARHIDSLLIEA